MSSREDRSSACFSFIPMSKIALRARLLPMGAVKMFVFSVYLEPAGTSMLIVVRPFCEGAVLPAAILFRLRTSACQEGIFFVVMWRRACLVRWSLRMNRRSHTGHTNFFSPVCVRRWRESSSDRANLLSQPSQLQLKGFSPKKGEKPSHQVSHYAVMISTTSLSLFWDYLWSEMVLKTGCNSHLWWPHWIPHPHNS